MSTSQPTPGRPKNPLEEGDNASLLRHQIHMPETGERVGQNRILELVAEGGMANVYKVWQEDLEIVRAIKILKPGFDEESKKRLATEAKISAHLRHPNIVEIYGLNFWHETIPYLEMEFIDGFSLKNLIERHRALPCTFSMALVYFICNALHYAHNQVFTLYGKTYEGIVHRDIKPANILLTRSGVPKLADFGIARPLDISLHTVGHMVMGTFTYLSPEQLNGEPLDRRSDIYSLGNVLYECITGAKVFPQRTLTELIKDKMKNNYRPIESLGVEVPKRLVGIVEKSMDIKCDRRYDTADEFGKELFDVFSKSTTDTPEQACTGYLSGHEAIDGGGIKRRSLVSPLAVFSVCFFLLAMVSVLVLTGVVKTDMLRGHKPPSPAVESAVPGPADTSPAADRVQAAPEKNTAAPAFPADAAVRRDTAAKPRKPAGADRLVLGCASARSGQWAEAITLLSAALAAPLPDSSRNLALVCLLESYLGEKDLAQARAIADAQQVNDGYFFLLCGETYLKSSMVEAAIESFVKARTVPSRYRQSLSKDATYLWATALSEAYMVKPNSGNRRACLRAWQVFTAGFCGRPDPLGQCRDAQERIRALSE
jgi:serine/threonine protein kinase